MRRPQWRKWSPGWWLTAGAGGSSGGTVSVGPIASLPVAGTQTGQTYVCTDSPYEFIWNGAAWLAFVYGYQVTPPVLANFTQVNVDASTLDTTHGGIIQTVTQGTSTLDLQGLALAIPASGTYYVDCAATFITTGSNGGFGSGIAAGLTAGSAVEAACSPLPAGNTFAWELLLWASTTGGVTVEAGPFTSEYSGPLAWFRIEDDRTNLYYSVSPNGYTWHQWYQHARTSLLTPADCGLYVNRYVFGGVIHWLHWSVHT
jgi:hypothetical protein